MASRRGIRPAWPVRPFFVLFGFGVLLVAVAACAPLPPASAGPVPPGPTDLSPPAGEILRPLPGSWTSYPSLNVRFMDPDRIMLSSIQMDIDGYALTVSTYGTGTVVEAYSYSNVRFSEGLHMANASASDAVGNGPTVLSWSFSVDTTPPVVTITNPVGNPVLPDGSVTLRWTGTETGSGIDHYEIRLDDGLLFRVGTATEFPFHNLTPGVHYFTVSATDVAGNGQYYTDDSYAVAVATVPPPPPTGPTDSGGNTTNQITVNVPEALPSWAIVLVAINAVEAAAIAWVALRGRRAPPAGGKSSP